MAFFGTEMIEIDEVQFVRSAASGKADLFRIDDEDFWIPCSVMDEHNLDPGEEGTIYVEEWFCQKEGIN